MAFRIAGALAGAAIAVLAFATSSWSSAWVVGTFVVVVVGGAAVYHLLTSVVRCPACSQGVVNLRIGSVDEKRKHFHCRNCGATAWLAEGFFWQGDFSG